VCIMYLLILMHNLLVLITISNYSVQRLDYLKFFGYVFPMCI
jgi:hypothetical protein